LDPPGSEDPLSWLHDEVGDQQSGFTYHGASNTSAGTGLVVTEEVRGQLALLAPWLKYQQPFLLVSISVQEGNLKSKCGLKYKLIESKRASLPFLGTWRGRPFLTDIHAKYA
jgi:hypothetical protein